ncbi:MAG: hypothetical protein ACPLKS_06670 [Caldisericum exile]|uniref:hypothetical protein n=1 Tax=Caldisericum exile TaxID=693075 RepID=UPI003C74F449
MQKEYKLKYPDWVSNNYVYPMCLSNDFDSLLSCKLLEEINGYYILYFYNFEGLYCHYYWRKDCFVGVDIDFVNGMCWGNHVTPFHNPYSANLNVIEKITSENYTKKYAGSTALQIWSYYDIPLPDNEEEKMILLAIDCFYKGFYNEKFRETQINYLEILEMQKLIDLLNKYTEEDFRKIEKKYNLFGKIFMQPSGKLNTNIRLAELSKIFKMDFSLPYFGFNKVKSFISKKCKGSNLFVSNIFSGAIIYKNYIVYSTENILCCERKIC